MRRSSVLARSASVSAAVLVVLGMLVPARAGDPIPPILPTASPSPSPAGSPTAAPKPKTTPKPKPKPNTTPKPPAPPRLQPKGPAPNVYNGPISDALAYWQDRPKSPSRTTTALLDLLQRLQPPGVSLDQAAVARGVWRFPIAGYTWYQDDWAAPRYLPYFHTHEGTDLFARDGTPVVACADGVISKLMNGSIGGVSIWLRANDGTVFYYGHLREYAANLQVGMPVRIGQVIATVGNTGVAIDTYPHLHFEIHPNGGAPIDPKPTVDRWLTEAEQRAIQAIKQGAALATSARVGAARWSALLGLLREPASEPASYWAAALDPTAAGRSSADAALERIGLEVDASIRGATPLNEHAEEASALSPALLNDGLLAGSVARRR